MAAMRAAVSARPAPELGQRFPVAAARPELDEVDAVWRSHGLPYRCCPQADQLAEHLADFRRGDEIAALASKGGRAEGIAGGVIAFLRVQQRHRHELRHRDGPLRLDQGGEAVLEAHAALETGLL